MSDEKHSIGMTTPVHVESSDGVAQEELAGEKISVDNNFEVFKKEDGAVDFRTVSWIHASMIFIKCQ